MADYWISFRISGEGAAWRKRYDDLQEAIQECATHWWTTDTSFLAIRSEMTIDEIGQRLKRALNTTDDHLVIRRIDYISTRYVNDPGEGFLAFFPLAMKL